MTAKLKSGGQASETRRFGMHPKLLLDVIKRQAGSLAKAILEGVMNSVDAGGDPVITIGAEMVTISDNGKGITEREQIETFFENFGHPHDESEGKTYGTFRMGRGQMFAYGVNHWETGPFAMDVDIKNKGLDYDLTSGRKPVKGCKIVIELYDRLLPSDLAETLRTIRMWVKYAPRPVTVNGVVANVDPGTEKWDHVTPEAYIRLTRTNGLAVYNLGIHTLELSNWSLGTGGVIVSRQQLKVNFARNDIQSDCPVWKKIKPLVNQKAQEKIAKKSELTEGERKRLADLVTQGEPPAGARELKLFTAVSGRHFSADQIRSLSYKYSSTITVCAQGSRIGDKIFKEQLAFVMAQETLDRFNVSTADELIVIIKDLMNLREEHTLYEYIPFASISKTFNDSFELLNESDLTPVERTWFLIADRASYLLMRDDRPRAAGESDRELFDSDADDEIDDLDEVSVTRIHRQIRVGRSETYDSWTDGATYVALDREFLRTLTMDAKGAADLGVAMLHSLCHDHADTEDHDHTMEFYETFASRTSSQLPAFIQGCLVQMPKALATVGRDMPKKLMRDADNTEKTVRSLRGLLRAAEEAQAQHNAA